MLEQRFGMTWFRAAANQPGQLCGSCIWREMTGFTGGKLTSISGECLGRLVQTCQVWWMQVKDLNSGAFGFVVLARDKKTSEQVAIKFLAKGPKITKVGSVSRMGRGTSMSPVPALHLPPSKTQPLLLPTLLEVRRVNPALLEVTR